MAIQKFECPKHIYIETNPNSLKLEPTHNGGNQSVRLIMHRATKIKNRLPQTYTLTDPNSDDLIILSILSHIFKVHLLADSTFIEFMNFIPIK